MNITIIFGSVRQSSLTRTLAHCLADCLLMRDASLNWVDLREQPLSIVDPDYHSHVEDNPSAAVRQFIKKSLRLMVLFLRALFIKGLIRVF